MFVDDQQLVACDLLLQAQPITIAIDPALLNSTVLQFSRSSQNQIANLMSFGTPPLQHHCQSRRNGLLQIGSHVKRGSLHTPFSSDTSDKSACSPPNMSDTRSADCGLQSTVNNQSERPTRPTPHRGMVQHPQGNWCRPIGIPCEVLGFIVEHEGDAFWCHQHSGMSSTAIKNYSLNISLRRRPEVVQFV